MGKDKVSQELSTANGGSLMLDMGCLLVNECAHIKLPNVLLAILMVLFYFTSAMSPVLRYRKKHVNSGSLVSHQDTFGNLVRRGSLPILLTGLCNLQL